MLLSTILSPSAAGAGLPSDAGEALPSSAWVGPASSEGIVGAPLPADTPSVVLPDGEAAPADSLPDGWTHGPGGLRIHEESRSIALSATLQSQAFMASLPPDHQYHALVHRDGSAAGKALFVTSVPDSTIARVLRELGADDGGGVPMSAWSLRWVPLVPQPDTRVQGSPVTVTVHWEGAEREHSLAELVRDSGGEGMDVRFGGNEEHHEHWASGCILCFFSCPGGVLSNAAYSIRDHQRGVTTFDAGEALPADGTEVTFIFTLAPG